MFIPAAFLIRVEQEYIYSYFLKFIKVMAFIYIFVNFFQVVAFLAFDRLPALAYKESVSVRFGSLLDDPNSFAFICSIFLFIFVCEKRLISIWWLSFLSFFLFLTQSLTGIFSVLLSFFIVSFFVSFYRPKFSGFYRLVTIFSFFSLVFLFFTIDTGFLFDFIESKRGSIEGHARSFSYLYENDFFSYVLPPANGRTGEVFYINIISDAGLLYAFLFFVFLIFINFKSFSILRLFLMQSKSDSGFKFSLISSVYILSVSIGLFNLPLLTVFPVNSFFWFFVGFVLFFKRVS
jgi:hypothetical protein